MNRKELLLSLLRALETNEAPKEGLQVQKGDFLDEASRVSTQAVTTELLRHRKESLIKLQAALRRFDEIPPIPDLCEECEEPIGEARLRAVPWATKCVQCQEREERNQRDVREGKMVRRFLRKNDYESWRYFEQTKKNNRF